MPATPPLISGNTSNVVITNAANGWQVIDTRVSGGGGGSSDYQVDTFANGSSVLANANLNWNNTATLNVSVTANGSKQANVAWSANLTAIGIPAIEAALASDNSAFAAVNSALGTTNSTFATLNTAVASAANTVSTFANGTIVLPNANLNFNNTATVNVVAAANGTHQSNVALSANQAAILAGVATANSSNVAVTYEANGQVQIDTRLSTGGGGGSPGGSNTDVQFNQAGSFGGSPNLTFNLAANTLNAYIINAAVQVDSAYANISGNASFGTAVNTNCVVTLGNSTPAWNQFTVVQCGPYGWIAGYPSDTNGMYIGYNCYWNGSSWTSIADAGAAFIQVSYAGIYGYTAPANTAGDVSVLVQKFSANATTMVYAAPTLSGWQNYGGGFNSADYYLDIVGVVHLRGLIKPNSNVSLTAAGVTNAVFSLPSGFEPSGDCIFSVPYSQANTGASYGTMRLTIYSNGSGQLSTGQRSNTTVSNIGTSDWVCLDGITFATF